MQKKQHTKYIFFGSETSLDKGHIQQEHFKEIRNENVQNTKQRCV